MKESFNPAAQDESEGASALLERLEAGRELALTCAWCGGHVVASIREPGLVRGDLVLRLVCAACPERFSRLVVKFHGGGTVIHTGRVVGAAHQK